MFLAMDIGNTTTMIGFFEKKELKGSFRVASSHDLTADDCGIRIHELLGFHAGRDKKVKKIGICSVVPTLTQVYMSMCEKYFHVAPLVLSHRTDLGFDVLYQDARQVGADRLANAAAARALYGYPCIIVDLGTATTYDIVDSNANYAGGLIAPGLWASAANLFEKTSRLFPVKIEKPESFIGTDTANSIKAGIYYGFIGQMEYIVNRIKAQEEMAGTSVIATGGYAEIFSDESGTIDHVDTELTLKGLQIVFDD